MSFELLDAVRFPQIPHTRRLVAPNGDERLSSTQCEEQHVLGVPFEGAHLLPT